MSHKFHTYTRSKIDYISSAQYAPTDPHYSNYSKISIFKLQKISVHPVDKIPQWILASTYTPRSRDHISHHSGNHKATSSRFQTIPQGKVESMSVHPTGGTGTLAVDWITYSAILTPACFLAIQTKGVWWTTWWNQCVLHRLINPVEMSEKSSCFVSRNECQLWIDKWMSEMDGWMLNNNIEIFEVLTIINFNWWKSSLPKFLAYFQCIEAVLLKNIFLLSILLVNIQVEHEMITQENELEVESELNRKFDMIWQIVENYFSDDINYYRQEVFIMSHLSNMVFSFFLNTSCMDTQIWTSVTKHVITYNLDPENRCSHTVVYIGGTLGHCPLW